MAIGERQPVKRSKKVEAKVKVERKGKASIWLLPFVMICELNSHPST
jgi:paraquat-inducible protein B